MTTPSTFLRQQRPSILFLFFAIFLFCCKSGESGCDNFIGYWVCPKKQFFDSTWRFNISKNGDSYIFQGNLDGALGKYTGVLFCEQGKLVLKGIPMVGDAPLSLIDNGKTILFIGETFQKTPMLHSE